jgi:flagellar hook-basal body complex protein FliE
VAAKSNFDELEEWITDIVEEVKNTLNEREVFMEVRETMPLTEHEAGENLVTDPAGFDVVLQVAEAATSLTSTQTGLDRTVKAYETLTQGVGDAEEQAELMFHPEDVSEIVMSAEESDLYFAKPDDLLGEDRVMLGEQGKEHKVQTRGDVDTPNLLKVLFQGLDLSQKSAITEPNELTQDTLHRVQQLPVIEVGAARVRSKPACPAQGRICYNCGIQGHLACVCTNKSNLFSDMDEGQSNQCIICLQIRNARVVEPEVLRCMLTRPAPYKGKFASVVASVATIDGCAGGGKPKDWSPLETGMVRRPAVMEWTSCRLHFMT